MHGEEGVGLGPGRVQHPSVRCCWTRMLCANKTPNPRPSQVLTNPCHTLLWSAVCLWLACARFRSGSQNLGASAAFSSLLSRLRRFCTLAAARWPRLFCEETLTSKRQGLQSLAHPAVRERERERERDWCRPPSGTCGFFATHPALFATWTSTC